MRNAGERARERLAFMPRFHCECVGELVVHRGGEFTGKNYCVNTCRGICDLVHAELVQAALLPAHYTSGEFKILDEQLQKVWTFSGKPGFYQFVSNRVVTKFLQHLPR